MNPPFHGKVALVTGAGSGIGAATARVLADRGASVVVTDIDTGNAEDVSDSIAADGGAAWPHRLDVASTDEWRAVADAVAARDGRLDVVVNNAFTIEVAPAHEQDDAAWARQLDVSLASVHRAVRTFVGPLRAARGAMVNVASVHALLGFPGHPAYAAAKGGMIALTRQLAVEYGPEIRVNAVLPGPILTPIWDPASEDYLDLTRRSLPAGRLGRPEEVATAIAFLASDDASFVSGATLLVDGGFSGQKDPR